jgi:hypothetical protein
MAEKIFDWWAQNYFLDPLSTLAALIGFLIFIVKEDKGNIAYIFLYYFIGYLLLKFIILDAIFLNLPFQLRENILQLIDYIFTLFEFLIFFIFFKKILLLKIHRRILVIISCLFLGTGCSLLLYDITVSGKVPPSSRNFVFNLQAFSLLVPSILYYLEIFKSKPTFNLLRTSSFWVVTGLSLFMISTLPFSLLLDFFWKDNQIVYNYVFNLFYIFYIILFSTIIRAYLCKPTTEK